MQVAITFENEDEAAEVLKAVARLGLTDKEQIETVLAENLVEALLSGNLRRQVRRAARLEAK